MTTYYTVDTEHGDEIASGLPSYDAALQVARRYLSARADAPCVNVYDSEGESWTLDRAEVLS